MIFKSQNGCEIGHSRNDCLAKLPNFPQIYFAGGLVSDHLFISWSAKNKLINKRGESQDSQRSLSLSGE